MFHALRAAASCLAIAVATVALPARGQVTLLADCSAPAPAAGAGAQPENAALLFERYQCALAAHEYARALEILDQACASSENAACAFNRALAYHAWLETPGDAEQEHCQLARESYVEFLALNPYQEQSEEARGALAELDRFCSNPAPPTSAAAKPVAGAIPAIEGSGRPRESVPAVASAPPAAPVADARSVELRRTLSWGLLGLGSAAAVAATVSWLHMRQADADLVEQRQPDGTIPRNAETRELDKARRDYQQMAWGLGAAAIPLLGLGTLGLLLTPHPESQVAPAIGPGLIGASYSGVF